MMTGICFLIFVATVVMAGITILNVCCVPDCSQSAPSTADEAPLVSILIPARNEERNLGTLLESLTHQTYPNFEVIVLDDNSTDATFRIGESFSDRFSAFSIIRGEELPEGWLGKPFACSQLRRRAQGDFLLFLDADVTLAPHAVSRLMQLFRAPPDIGLLSCFPNQLCYSWAERLIVPLIDLILYSCAPLALFERSLNPRFAAANGQCMLFRADVYDAIGGHGVVRMEILEDIELARSTKRTGYQVRVIAGAGGVQCRMYRTISDIFQGFGKNCFVAVGKRGWQALLVAAFFSLVFVFPFFFSGFSWLALVDLGVILLIRISIAVRFRHHVTFTVIGHIPAMLLAIGIFVYSWGWFSLGSPQWKGRLLK